MMFNNLGKNVIVLCILTIFTKTVRNKKYNLGTNFLSNASKIRCVRVKTNI